jgi:hypothetical protein
VASSQINVNSDGPQNPLFLFWNTVIPRSGWIPNNFVLSDPSNPVWNTIDLTLYGVPTNAVWAMIGGIYIITGAGEIRMLPRGVGSSDSVANYEAQSLSASTSGGLRDVGMDIVPLSNGKFELWAAALPYPNPGGPLPQCAVNFKIKAYGV